MTISDDPYADQVAEFTWNASWIEFDSSEMWLDVTVNCKEGGVAKPGPCPKPKAAKVAKPRAAAKTKPPPKPKAPPRAKLPPAPKPPKAKTAPAPKPPKASKAVAPSDLAPASVSPSTAGAAKPATAPTSPSAKPPEPPPTTKTVSPEDRLSQAKSKVQELKDKWNSSLKERTPEARTARDKADAELKAAELSLPKPVVPPASTSPAPSPSAKPVETSPSEVPNPKTTIPNHPASKKMADGLNDPNLSAADKKVFARTVISTMNKLPKASLDAIHKNMDKAVFCGTANDVAVHSVMKIMELGISQKVALEHVAKGGGKALGVCISMPGQLARMISDGGGAEAPGSAYGVRDSGAAGTFNHELGHIIDGSDHTHSGSPGWNAAFKGEIDVRDSSGQHALSRYARTSPSEGFAEFSRLVHSDTIPLKEVEAKFPKAAGYWKAAGIWPKDTGSVKNAERTSSKGDAKPMLSEMFGKRVQLPGSDFSHMDVKLEDPHAADVASFEQGLSSK